MFAKTPEPPYYAVIFTSKRTAADAEGYAAMAEEMDTMVRAMPGFLGVDSARDADGVGITVSYFRDEESIRAWKAVPEHRDAQSQGRARWYEAYEVRVCKVERAYHFTSGTTE